jgi:predicted Rdx family selenoprotein
VSATHDLLNHFQHVIEELRLVTGSKGVFDVVVDGEVIYSKHAEGRHAAPGEVLDRFRNLIGSKVRQYGT